MSEPSVCAVMLTANRPAMARQAVECFRRQTYANKRLLILDSSKEAVMAEQVPHNAHIQRTWIDPKFYGEHTDTIGGLRNVANEEACQVHSDPEILIHFDDDDWSHPNRITEQVALLQSSGADCVGYNQMLFWRAKNAPGNTINETGEAWLYANRHPAYALGTSLCYWRNIWSRKPFEALNQGEDTRWIAGLNCMGISAVPDVTPRMIARIHPGNTSNAYHPGVMRACERQGGEWRRVPEWDAHCKSTMEAK